MTQNPYQAPRADVQGASASGVAKMDQARFDELFRENKKLNNVSLLAGFVGLLLQMFPSLAIKFVGTMLLMVGLAYYAKMKGRNGAWGLLAFLSILGFLFAALLPKYCRNCEEREKKKICSNCGAPVGI